MRELPGEPQWQRCATPNRRKRGAPGVAFKRMWAGLRQVLGCFFMLVFLGLGLVGGGRLWHRALTHPRLQLHQIVVTGVVRAREADILAYAEAALHTPMLTLDLDAMALGVRRHPWVRTVRVRRQFPDRLSIDVTEHEPNLLVALGGLYVADEDGALFKTFDLADHLDLPVLSGLQRNVAGTVDALPQRVREAIALCNAVENHPASLGTLDELHWDNDVGWSLMLRQSHEAGTQRAGAGVRVHMGREPITRLPVVVETMQVLARRHQTPKVIWADFVKNPKRVQVQLVTLRDNPPRTQASVWRRA